MVLMCDRHLTTSDFLIVGGSTEEVLFVHLTKSVLFQQTTHDHFYLRLSKASV